MILLRLLFLFFNGMLCPLYIVSKLAINTPDADIIISGGAIIANNVGNVPFEPNALNIFNRKYNTKHVNMPRLNFFPKLWLRR